MAILEETQRQRPAMHINGLLSPFADMRTMSSNGDKPYRRHERMVPALRPERHRMLIRTPRDLGAVIRDRRQRRGWSQRELAERVGASRQWVNAVEKGKARTEVGLALRALDALDVTLRLDRDDRANDEDDGLDIDAIDIDKIVDSAREKGR